MVDCGGFRKRAWLVLACLGLLSGQAYAQQMANCKNDLKIVDKGNTQYAWKYVNNNNANRMINATIKNSWNYQHERRSETKVVKLSPGESKNIFNFPRNQQPKSEVVGCYFEN